MVIQLVDYDLDEVLEKIDMEYWFNLFNMLHVTCVTSNNIR